MRKDKGNLEGKGLHQFIGTAHASKRVIPLPSEPRTQ
jgi:hypothetical protein